MSLSLLATATWSPGSPVVEALGWTLVHFVWQGAAAALALAALLTPARSWRPQIRYCAGCVTLSLMALIAGLTFARELTVAEHRSAPADPSPTLMAIAEPVTARDQSPTDVDAGRSGSSHAHSIPGAVEKADEVPLRAGSELPAHRSVAVGELVASPTRPADPNFVRSDFLRDRFPQCLPWLVAVWVTGVGLLSLRLVGGWRVIGRIRGAGCEVTDPVWNERFARLRDRLQVPAAVKLLSSTSASVPLVVGWIKPVVLFPAGMLTGLSVIQVEALVVHELAHIRRHDYLVNLAQNVIETLLFYHPAVWWVSTQIRKEREHCCDDIAASACGTLDYAHALASLAELRHAAPGFGLAINGAPLIDRIRRLAGVQPSPGRETGWLAIAGLVVLVAAIGLRPSEGFRAESEDKPLPTTELKQEATKKGTSPRTEPNTDQRKVRGRIVDQEGKPIRDARLWWVVLLSRSRPQDFTVAGTSGPDGQFEMRAPEAWKPEPPQRRNAGVLWILAPGMGVKMVAADGSSRDGIAANLVVQLDPAPEIVYKVNDPLGRPVPGAVVEPLQFFRTGATFFFPEPVGESLRTIADKSGHVHFHSIPRDFFCWVEVTAPRFGRQRFRWSEGDATAIERALTLRPAGRVTGRLITNDPQSVRGTKLFFQTGAVPSEAEGVAVATADEAGRFVIPEIAEGDLQIYFAMPAKSALLPSPALRTLRASESINVDIPMVRSIVVHGTILTQDTRQPVVGAEDIRRDAIRQRCLRCSGPL